ncbi:hypothetical protein ACRALDRAFT_1083854 [Sodiomyces alcalophilus JCM 7366]|uniref:uncharacterized protein n=1 Tax=Sodiomyces alcalophilus JCM 7366 TaxID=591952 RepID=UPI0039B6018A
MSNHHLEEISSGRGERVSLYIRWNNARLIIHVDPSPSSTDTTTIENSFIERYNVASDAEDDDKADTLANEILDAIVGAGKTVFDKLAPPPAQLAGISTDLHTLLLPDEYAFCFRTLDGKTELIRCDIDGTHDGASLDPFGHPFQLHVNDDFNLPRFSTKDIRVLENILHNGYIARVAVDGSEICSKAGDSRGPEAAQRELDCLWKITTSQYASTIRVPKLLGLITTPDDKRIVGFLEDYIPVSDTWELSTLGSIDAVSEIAPDRRRKWASQVQETIHLLHQIGVVWGDGKASNVLVHRDTDDAWIIDFGGGWTDGWVNPELSGTVEGDEVAVKKIFEFLEVLD